MRKSENEREKKTLILLAQRLSPSYRCFFCTLRDQSYQLNLFPNKNTKNKVPCRNFKFHVYNRKCQPSQITQNNTVATHITHLVTHCPRPVQTFTPRLPGAVDKRPGVAAREKRALEGIRS